MQSTAHSRRNPASTGREECGVASFTLVEILLSQTNYFVQMP